MKTKLVLKMAMNQRIKYKLKRYKVSSNIKKKPEREGKRKRLNLMVSTESEDVGACEIIK
jgi:hypothetical protein